MSQTPAIPPARRPILVWIICLYHFIVPPIAMLGAPMMPYFTSVAKIHAQNTETKVDAALNASSIPAVRIHLLSVREHLHATEKHLDLESSSFGIPQILFVETKSALLVLAAILLFKLRRAAFVLFLAVMLLRLGFYACFYFAYRRFSLLPSLPN